MSFCSRKGNKSDAVKQPHHQGELCQEAKKRGLEGVFRVDGPYPYFGSLHNGAMLGSYAKGFLGRVEFIYVESIPMRWSELLA